MLWVNVSFTSVEIATQQFPSVPCGKDVISSESDPLGGGEAVKEGISLKVCSESSKDNESHCLCPILPPSLEVSSFAHHMLMQRDSTLSQV